MNKPKCSNCGLVNFGSDMACRRCGVDLEGRRRSDNSPRNPREAAKRSSPIYTLLLIAVIGGAIAYNFLGVERSYNETRSDDVNRVSVQAQPQGLSSRSDEAQKRTGQYKNAIQNSPALAESQRHADETEKLLKGDQQKPR
jgi:hypothetical protein